MEVRQADLMPVRQRFYDEDEKLVRELTFSEYKTVGGRLIPTRLVMRSAYGGQVHKDGKKAGAVGGVLAQGVMRPLDQVVEQTTITYEKIVFDEPISQETFSLGNLKQ